MINGVHALIYAKDATKTRAFFKDVLKLRTVDAGQGWLIFALPPAELGIHPLEDGSDVYHELYLMCDDMKSTLADLERRGVVHTPPVDAGWGVLTSIAVPGGGTLGLYQPKHPTAIAARQSSGRTPKTTRSSRSRVARKRKPVAKPRSRRKR